MATIPVYNPQSPFLGQIPGGFRVGSTIKIRATVQGFQNRCQINIQTGAALKPRDDCVLHISVRPQENVIIRNHLKDQVWGHEERYGGNYVYANQPFEIAIYAEPSHFRISVNTHPFCTFNYRLPLSSAQFVSVSGTCMIEYITIDQHNPMYPSHGGGPLPVHNVPHFPPQPPPMPPSYPPPYPGHYPDQPAVSYSDQKDKDKKNLKVAAGVGAVAGLTAVAFTKAASNLRKLQK